MRYAKMLHYASVGILFKIRKEEELVEWCSQNGLPYGTADERIESLEEDLAAIRCLQSQEDAQ